MSALLSTLPPPPPQPHSTQKKSTNINYPLLLLNKKISFVFSIPRQEEGEGPERAETGA
jgi:hypothetical protein